MSWCITWTPSSRTVLGSCCCGSHFGAGQNPLVQCDVWPIRLFGSERSGAMVAMAIHIPYQIGNQLELLTNSFPSTWQLRKAKMGSLWMLEIDEIDRWLCARKWWQLVWRTFHSATHVMPLKMRNFHLYNGTHDDETMGYGGRYHIFRQTHRFGCAWYNIFYWVSPYNYITYVHYHLTTKNLEGAITFGHLLDLFLFSYIVFQGTT